MLEPRLQEAVQDRVVAPAQTDATEVDVGRRHLVVEPRPFGHRQTPLELLESRPLAGHQLDGTDVAQRMRDDPDLVQALTELERAIRPEPGPLCVIGMHAKRRDAGVREAQLASGRQPLQHRHGLITGLLGRADPTWTPHELRALAQGAPLREPVADLAVALRGQVERLDRLVELIGDVALVRAALQQVAPLRARETIGVPECSRVLRGGLAVRPEGGRPQGRGRRELEHGVDVAGRLGVMRESRQVRACAGALAQSAQGVAMQPGAFVRADRALDRQSRQLVPERDSVAVHLEHARGEALVEMRDARPCEGAEQIHLHARRNDRHRLEQAVAPGDTRPARARTASTTVGGISSSPAARTSVTKNGLPSVRRCRSSASTRRGPASSSTAVTESAGSWSRRTPADLPTSPSTSRSGWPRSSSSSR